MSSTRISVRIDGDGRIEPPSVIGPGVELDGGARVGRAGRLRRKFPDVGVVVFGHSHAPVDEEGVDGQRLFNPGSPTERRGQPHHTIGILDLAGGAVEDHRIVTVD